MPAFQNTIVAILSSFLAGIINVQYSIGMLPITSTTVTLGPIKNNLIILSLYLSTVFQSFRAGEKGYYVTYAHVISLGPHVAYNNCGFLLLLFLVMSL